MIRAILLQNFLRHRYVDCWKDSLFRRMIESEMDAVYLYSEAISDIIEILCDLKILTSKEAERAGNRLHKDYPKIYQDWCKQKREELEEQ